jgi:hypothetical protein
MKLFTIRLPLLMHDEASVQAVRDELVRFLSAADLHGGRLPSGSPCVVIEETWRDEALTASDPEAMGMSNQITMEEALDW